MTAPTNVRTCYRHPDRVAGISCQRCDRPICPSCMHQASVGFHCPECAKTGRQKVLQGAASWTVRPLVTQVLIGINVVAYIGMVLTMSTEPFTAGGVALWGGDGDGGIFADGLLFGAFVSKEPWRLVTNGFLHLPFPFGILHILLNMLALMRLGQVLEPILGRARFISLYAVGLVGGSLGVVILDPTSRTIGASGAVFGLMGGAVMVARDRNVDLWSSGLIQTIGINLLFTFTLANYISVGGHVGGLIGGFVGGAILTMGARQIRQNGETISAVITGAVAIGILVLAYVLMANEYADFARRYIP